MTVPQAAQWSPTVAILLWFVLITTGALLVVFIPAQFTVHTPLTTWVHTQCSTGTYVTYAQERAIIIHAHASGVRRARILFRSFIIAFQPQLDPSSHVRIANEREGGGSSLIDYKTTHTGMCDVNQTIVKICIYNSMAPQSTAHTSPSMFSLWCVATKVLQ